jgi:hypothetical protein
MTDKQGISYKAGGQWARMSWSSRIGAIAAVGLLIVAVGIWHRANQVPSTAITSVAAPSAVAPSGPSPADAETAQREAQAKLLRSKCTEGLHDLLKASRDLLAAGDEHMAAATLNPCIPISTDPTLTALVKKVEAARIVKVAKATREEATRKKKSGVQIGMSKDAVIASMWGKPRKINRTTTAHGTREQWVYDGGYLYFEDDTLTTIQN